MKTFTKILYKKKLNKNIKLLDIGCGNGDLVNELLKLNIDCYGTDIKFKEGLNKNDLIKKKRLIKMIGNSSRNEIDRKNYKIPFNNNFFDIVISDQTIEHVKNLDQFVDESYRVLKKSGTFYSYFPSKYKYIEPHVGIPFGGIFNTMNYIKFCYKLGFIRKKYNYKDSYNDIYRYLKNSTFHRNEKEIRFLFSKKFKYVKFDSNELIKAFNNHPNFSISLLSKIILMFPYGELLFRIFNSKFLICKK